MTQDVYLGRNSVNAQAANALELAFGSNDESHG